MNSKFKGAHSLKKIKIAGQNVQACKPSARENIEFKVKFRCRAYSRPGWATLAILPQNKRERQRQRHTERERQRHRVREYSPIYF